MSEHLSKTGNSQASKPEAVQPRGRRLNKRKAAVAAGLLLAATASAGYAIEANTNDVAEGKIKTAEICRGIDPHAAVITEKIDECMERGVPGGDHVAKDKLRVGDPAAFLDVYIQSQRNEAANIELGRIAAWSAGIPVVTAIVVASS